MIFCFTEVKTEVKRRRRNILLIDFGFYLINYIQIKGEQELRM